MRSAPPLRATLPEATGGGVTVSMGQSAFAESGQQTEFDPLAYHSPPLSCMQGLWTLGDSLDWRLLPSCRALSSHCCPAVWS